MALAPLQLADINIGTAIVGPPGTVAEGRASAYMQRWLQENNRRVTSSVAGVQQALADLAAQQATLAAQQAQLTAQQALLTSQQAQLTSQQAQLTDTVNKITGVTLTGGIFTNGSGLASWTHGLNPSFSPQLGTCTAFTTGTTIYLCQMQFVSGGPGGVLEVMFWDATGAPVVSSFVPCVLHVAGI